jgi:hypothetical protein
VVGDTDQGRERLGRARRGPDRRVYVGCDLAPLDTIFSTRIGAVTFMVSIVFLGMIVTSARPSGYFSRIAMDRQEATSDRIPGPCREYRDRRRSLAMLTAGIRSSE